MRRKNIVNDIKISFKVIGCFGLLFAVVAVMMLCARQYVSDQDSMYRQYIGSIRETGELKAVPKKPSACKTKCRNRGRKVTISQE